MSSIPFASGTSRKKMVKRISNKTNFFLIEYPSKSITGCQLPTLRQAFKVLVPKKNILKKNRSTAWSQAEYVVDSVLEFWRMAGIKTITKNNCVMRIQKKCKEWCDSAKSKSRIRDVGGKRALFVWSMTNSWILVPKMLLQLHVKIGCWQLRIRKKILLFMPNNKACGKLLCQAKTRSLKINL